MTLLKIFKSPIVWLLVVIAALLLMIRQVRRMHQEITRLGSNQEVLLQTQEQILLANGRIASQTGVLQLRQQELLRMFPRLYGELKTLGIKPRSVQTVSTTSFGLQQSLTSTLRDSIVFVPKQIGTIGFHYLKTTGDSLRFRVFSYHDSYYDVSGYALLDKQFLHISTRDTMTQVVFYKRKHPWLWIFSRKELMQRVYFKNPNAAIYYSRIIQLQR